MFKLMVKKIITVYAHEISFSGSMPLDKISPNFTEIKLLNQNCLKVSIPCRGSIAMAQKGNLQKIL